MSDTFVCCLRCKLDKLIDNDTWRDGTVDCLEDPPPTCSFCGVYIGYSIYRRCKRPPKFMGMDETLGALRL